MSAFRVFILSVRFLLAQRSSSRPSLASLSAYKARASAFEITSVCSTEAYELLGGGFGGYNSSLLMRDDVSSCDCFSILVSMDTFDNRSPWLCAARVS